MAGPVTLELRVSADGRVVLAQEGAAEVPLVIRVLPPSGFAYEVTIQPGTEVAVGLLGVGLTGMRQLEERDR